MVEASSRGCLHRLGAVLLALLGAFLLLEVALRLGGYSFDVGKVRQAVLRESADAELRYELIPGADGWAWLCDVAVDARGFRVAPGAMPAPESLAVVGDSIAFGVFLPPEASYPARLEAALRARGRPVAVWNAAVPGYDVVQVARHLEARVLPQRPARVVFLYDLNDAGVAAQDVRARALADRLHNSPLGRSRALRLAFHLGEVAHLSLDFTRRNAPGRFARDYAGHQASLEGDDELARLMAAAGNDEAVMGRWYTERGRVARVRHSFERIARAADAAGTKVILALFPWLGTTPPYPYQGAHELVAYEAARVGLEVVDLLPALRAASPDLAAHTHFPRDPFHPNRAAVEVAARATAEALAASSPAATR